MSSRQHLSPITLKIGRDDAVDVIKGAACLLMVVAHVPFARARWLSTDTMGAVLFFASTGMNLAGIVEQRRDQEKRLAVNALFLIFAGFADNYVQGTLESCDVFQIAGMSILAMLALRRFLPRYWTWLFPLPFLVHFANQRFHWKVAAGGVSSFFLTPGLFPLLPWLGFYLLGAHLKKYDGQRMGWMIGALALASVVMFALFSPFRFNKYWMSGDYFLIGCAVTAWWFAGLRRWLTEGSAGKLVEIRRWGANSLVFYILNNFVIRALQMVSLKGVALFLLALALTAFLLRPALSLQTWTARLRPRFVLLAGVIISIAVLAANFALWPQSFHLRTLASFGLTFSFIACYPAWKNISRAIATPSADIAARERKTVGWLAEQR